LFASLGAFPLDGASQDAALSVTLGSAPYSAQVTSANGQNGVALAEGHVRQRRRRALFNGQDGFA
jgi:hypothetical protein